MEAVEILVSLLDYKSLPRVINFYCAGYHRYNDLSYNDSGQLEWFGWSVWSSGWGDFVVQLVEVSSGRSWCLSGWDCHGCQSCVLLRVVRLVTGQYILDGKHTSYLSFFLHGQNFWRIKFTPKNANFSR